MKRHSTLNHDSMHEIAPRIGKWRRRLRFLVPRKWLAPAAVPGAGIRGRRPSPARMELDPESPAKSWAAWEVSRGLRPGARSQ